MHHQEEQEVLVVALPNALVQPDTMVVEFGHTMPTERAMLASRWLGDVASTADHIICEDQLIEMMVSIARPVSIHI